MASFDALEKIKSALQVNEKQLTWTVEDANRHLELLHHQKGLADENLVASKQRYEKLKILSNRICYDCWAILPVLGPEIHRISSSSSSSDNYNNYYSHPSSSSSNNNNNPHPHESSNDIIMNICVNCGIDMDETKKCNGTYISRRHRKPFPNIDVPSSDMGLLEVSRATRKESKEIINGKSTFSGNKSTLRRSSNSSLLLMSPFSRMNNHSSLDDNNYDSMDSLRDNDFHDYNYDNNNTIMAKIDYLDEVGRQLKLAKKRVSHVESSIEKWTNYTEKYQLELRRVKSSIEKVKNKELFLLEAKLCDLGQISPSAITGNNNNNNNNNNTRVIAATIACCDICLEIPTSKVAFQCGHICCSSCANGMEKCHMCRKYIEQQIRLYE